MSTFRVKHCPKCDKTPNILFRRGKQPLFTCICNNKVKSYRTWNKLIGPAMWTSTLSTELFDVLQRNATFDGWCIYGDRQSHRPTNKMVDYKFYKKLGIDLKQFETDRIKRTFLQLIRKYGPNKVVWVTTAGS